MSETVPEEEVPSGSGRRKLVLIAVVLIAGLGSFAAGYLGFVSLSGMFAGGDKAEEEHAPMFAYLDVPRIMVPMAGRNKQLVLSIKLEGPPENMAEAELLMPRVVDSFNSFLSDIDPAALDRRGVLEIIRTELRTRADMILGAGAIDNLLITEFAIQ